LKAVFVKQSCLLQKRQGATGPLELCAGVQEGLQSLSETDLLLILVDPGTGGCSEAAALDDVTSEDALAHIQRVGGRVDAIVLCPHNPEDACDCWGTYPGFLYHAAAQLELRLEECYLLCNEPNDVLLAHMVGCRPIFCLDGHSIGDFYDGHQPEPRDFPIARSFQAAVEYVLAEEEANELWGHPRPPSSMPQLEGDLVPAGETPEFSPTLKVLSPLSVAKKLSWPSLLRVDRRARQWLVLFVFGGVWLSLGIAYILTHLYRVQPFPEFVYYLTLQFIPRPARGALFIVTGVVIVAVSVRAFSHLFSNQGGTE